MEHTNRCNRYANKLAQHHNMKRGDYGAWTLPSVESGGCACDCHADACHCGSPHKVTTHDLVERISNAKGTEYRQLLNEYRSAK